MSIVLLAFCLVVAVFTGFAWYRLMVILADDAAEQKALDEWFANREKYRRRARESSLYDDSQGLINEKTDTCRGPKAA